jgi:hypothetical protein
VNEPIEFPVRIHGHQDEMSVKWLHHLFQETSGMHGPILIVLLLFYLLIYLFFVFWIRSQYVA